MSKWQPLPFVRDLDQQQREANIRDAECLERDIEAAMADADTKGDLEGWSTLVASYGVHHLYLKKMRELYDAEYRNERHDD